MFCPQGLNTVFAPVRFKAASAEVKVTWRFWPQGAGDCRVPGYTWNHAEGICATRVTSQSDNLRVFIKVGCHVTPNLHRLLSNWFPNGHIFLDDWAGPCIYIYIYIYYSLYLSQTLWRFGCLGRQKVGRELRCTHLSAIQVRDSLSMLTDLCNAFW